MKLVRIAMIGDIVGNPGIEALEAALPCLIEKYKIDFVTVNGENAADGFGISESDFRRIIAAGADVVTSGNHIWHKREFWSILENEKNMLRPANYPNGVSGAGFVLIEKNGINWLVINLQGREFMTNAIDCPFQCFDRILNSQDRQLQSVVVVDFHAESSREKEALGFYADGRAALIAGTHTHVQTADERILPNGSAYITDLGMTGINNSVIGMDADICLNRFCKQVQYQMKLAEAKEPGQVCGVITEIDADTRTAISIWRI